jgi:hypothetical protein
VLILYRYISSPGADRAAEYAAGSRNDARAIDASPALGRVRACWPADRNNSSASGLRQVQPACKESQLASTRLIKEISMARKASTRTTT